MIVPHNALDPWPIEPGTVQAVVTSPPYLEQRSYGTDDHEIGHEATVDAYAAKIADVFDHARTALRPDGLAWLNLGDKANGSGGAGGDWTRNTASRPTGAGARRFLDPSYPDRTFLDVPGAVLRELLHRGWRLRAHVVWDKGRDQAEDLKHVRRPRYAHEPIFLLAPGPAPTPTIDGSRRFTGTPVRPRFFPSMLTETGTVWHFPPGSSGPAHLAPFPDELARRCILPSTLPGDLVVDPFAGSGTVERVAHELGRRSIGFDLYLEAEEQTG